MGRLKNIHTLIRLKVKASSITETIAATSIIIIVFTITVISLNAVLQNIVENDTVAIERTISEVTYKSNYEELKVPDSFEEGNWIVHLTKEEKNNIELIVIEALNRKTKKTFVKTIISNGN